MRSREEIKAELLQINKRLWADWDKHKVAYEIPERNFIVKETFDKRGLATVMATYKAEGLTWEMIKPFYDDPQEFFDATMPETLQ